MKLSIIVPVYNVEKYLPQCLDSLVKQTLEDYEIIIVNDGSPDKSQQIIDDYSSRYPGLIKSLVIENGGQGRARNFGLDIARGDYIGFADSDDWVEPDMFKTMYDAALDNSADVVICDVVAFFPDGREEYIPSAYREDMPLAAAGSCCDKIFRRQLLEGIRFPVGLWYEDFSFSVKVIYKAKRIVHVKKGMYKYRCGQISTMRNNNSLRNLEIIEIMDDIRKSLPEIDGTDSFDALIIGHVLLDSINRVALHVSKDRNAVIKCLRDYCRENVPDLTGSPAFKRETKNRRIIMWLNYHGLHDISGIILATKRWLKGK